MPPITDPDSAIEQWLVLFNAGAYFEAHEALEPAWLADRSPERSFLKGLIHAAVALCHYQRGNGHGARVKYGSAVRYLSPYGARHRSVAVGELLEQMERFFAPLLRLPKGTAPPAPDTAWPRARRDGAP